MGEPVWMELMTTPVSVPLSTVEHVVSEFLLITHWCLDLTQP